MCTCKYITCNQAVSHALTVSRIHLDLFVWTVDIRSRSFDACNPGCRGRILFWGRYHLGYREDRLECPSGFCLSTTRPTSYKRGSCNVRALSRTFFGFRVIASFARFAGMPNIVPKFTTSSGPRTPISEWDEPDEKMIPFPPVIRMISRAFERKFWRYRLATSGGVLG